MSNTAKAFSGQNDPLSGSDIADAVSETAQDFKSETHPPVATFKEQASQAVEEAKSTVAALADEARARLSDIVDQQKSVGADQVAGVARAAHTAAGDLQKTSPQLARLMQQAAESVDHVADEIRGSDISDIVAKLSSFGRRQPVMFFGGAVVAGFVLARFLKSDAHSRDTADRSTDHRPV